MSSVNVVSTGENPSSWSQVEYTFGDNTKIIVTPDNVLFPMSRSKRIPADEVMKIVEIVDDAYRNRRMNESINDVFQMLNSSDDTVEPMKYIDVFPNNVILREIQRRGLKTPSFSSDNRRTKVYFS